jgi:hypothetical protein
MRNVIAHAPDRPFRLPDSIVFDGWWLTAPAAGAVPARRMLQLIKGNLEEARNDRRGSTGGDSGDGQSRAGDTPSPR